jgi:hypothetical protein
VGLADTLAAALDADAPPAGLAPPAEALWWIAKGGWRVGDGWERAHEICQQAEGEPSHDLVHGLAHLIEGDLPNAGYWYRRAGVARISDDPREEWRAVAAVIGG